VLPFRIDKAWSRLAFAGSSWPGTHYLAAWYVHVVECTVRVSERWIGLAHAPASKVASGARVAYAPGGQEGQFATGLTALRAEWYRTRSAGSSGVTVFNLARHHVVARAAMPSCALSIGK